MNVAPENPPPPIEVPQELERLRASVRHRLFGQPLEGVRIGRYTLQRCIGRGGMGVVWAADDDALGRTVAIKLLRPELNTAGVARLDKEARALARLSHPNVVGVFDVGTHEGHRFIAMEYVEGETLRAWLAVPRSLPEILDAFLDAGRGLAAAHEVGLVHRDFKPDNVLVGIDGRARVLDFGLARPPSAALDGPPSVDAGADPRATALTQAGALLGTPAYMAPEQHLGLPADARSDQFSYAVALLEAVFGEPPFAGDDLRMFSLAVVRGDVRRRDVPGVSPSLEAALLRALAVEPDARFDELTKLLDVLDRERRRLEDGAVDPGFDTQQVESVLQRAAALQADDGARPRLSAQELEAVAAEAGIDPAHARRAALEAAATQQSDLAKPPRDKALVPPEERHGGLRTGLSTVRQLDVRPTSTALKHIAAELERVEGKGRADFLGESMTWTGRQLEVHVDPKSEGGSIMLWRRLTFLAIRRTWSYTAAGLMLATMFTVSLAEGVELFRGSDAEIIPVLIASWFLGAWLARRLARKIHERDLRQREARLNFTADRLAVLATAPGDSSHR